MCRQTEENRLHVRFPFRALASYRVLGDNFHPPQEVPAETEIIDVSDYGAEINLGAWALKEDFMVVLRIPVPETRTTVPTLADVRWVKEGLSGTSCAGLSFIL